MQLAFDVAGVYRLARVLYDRGPEYLHFAGVRVCLYVYDQPGKCAPFTFGVNGTAAGYVPA